MSNRLIHTLKTTFKAVCLLICACAVGALCYEAIRATVEIIRY